MRKALLRKGAEINERLTGLLSGEQVSVEALLAGGKAKPGESPIERLRRFMRIVDGALERVRNGSYGRCQSCGDGLPFAQLEQVPWIDTCPACAARADAT